MPVELYCLEPHSYKSLGAPYGDSVSPWMLRGNVVDRLLAAQKHLKEIDRHYSLAIFDAWRPIRVQQFMYDYAINQECLARGVNRKENANSLELKEVFETVSKFWAEPSLDLASPPPHSTGGAVDLTISCAKGIPLDMGGEIDCIGPVSEPNYYIRQKEFIDHPDYLLWHSRRVLLSDAMKKSGFVQHPHEWWHFSYGDQLWAWVKNLQAAHYGAVEP
ncbi:D-ala-D-ala dipeptidase [Prochlorococcus sp. MIT 0602]|uniref:M15 family metallopeptidase n=1 Tax=unclassified Prochlorococcus TaxID=2627481 RepID=UPI000533771C|nr:MULTISPECIES: M15 family metallopeptidase [unclassified Prochlorococcus]KGG15147.1 D-ala-D-ala dipeptidase [Prochlorococcus sp. MIT 0602]KGG17419.1 D-ala-D-ala dipeptidase [Prochlorococcus sp. MIT 0603]